MAKGVAIAAINLQPRSRRHRDRLFSSVGFSREGHSGFGQGRLGHTYAFNSSGVNISSMLKLSEVLRYFVAWQNAQTSLRVLLSTSDGKFSFDCTLSRFSDTGISLQLSVDSDSVDLDLTGYHFEPLDEKAASIPHEDIPAHPRYARGLKGIRRPQETLLILEILR